jgi:riboflavin biosynthesis pyrimidine reductase
MYRIWPAGEPATVDDAQLIELYRPTVPALRINFVTSTDGAVEVDGYSAGLGTPGDKRVFGLLRMFADGLLVGAGTLRHEGYHAVTLDERRRDWRTAHGLHRYPRLVVVSRRLDLAPTHPALAESPLRPIILTSEDSPPDARTALASVADVLTFGKNEVDLVAGLAALRERGLTQLLSEGGPHLLGALTAADLVDELCLTVSPLLAGAGSGRITAGPPSVVRNLRLAHALFDEQALLLRYARAERDPN